MCTFVGPGLSERYHVPKAIRRIPGCSPDNIVRSRAYRTIFDLSKTFELIHVQIVEWDDRGLPLLVIPACPLLLDVLYPTVVVVVDDVVVVVALEF